MGQGNDSFLPLTDVHTCVCHAPSRQSSVVIEGANQWRQGVCVLSLRSPVYQLQDLSMSVNIFLHNSGSSP